LLLAFEAAQEGGDAGEPAELGLAALADQGGGRTGTAALLLPAELLAQQGQELEHQGQAQGAGQAATGMPATPAA
jgi:hypothetical protein